MAIYSTLFLASSGDLSSLFPGWKQPLTEPREIVHRNPFTGEERIITSTQPDWEDEAEAKLPELNVAVIEDNYLDYLEKRIPNTIQAIPHICSKGFTHIEYEPLSKKLGIVPLLEPAFYGPPSAGAVVMVFNDPFQEKLADLDEVEATDIAMHWAKEMSSPQYTHTEEGEQIADGWTTDFAISILGPLKTIAMDGWHNKLNLYLLIEY